MSGGTGKRGEGAWRSGERVHGKTRHTRNYIARGLPQSHQKKGERGSLTWRRYNLAETRFPGDGINDIFNVSPEALELLFCRSKNRTRCLRHGSQACTTTTSEVARNTRGGPYRTVGDPVIISMYCGAPISRIVSCSAVFTRLRGSPSACTPKHITHLLPKAEPCLQRRPQRGKTVTDNSFCRGEVQFYAQTPPVSYST